MTTGVEHTESPIPTFIDQAQTTAIRVIYPNAVGYIEIGGKTGFHIDIRGRRPWNWWQRFWHRAFFGWRFVEYDK